MTLLELKHHVEEEHLLLDIRSQDAFQSAHIRGALSAPWGFPGWGSAVSDWVRQNAPDRPLVLFSDRADDLHEAQAALSEREIAVAGGWDGGIDPWRTAGLFLVEVPSLTVDALKAHPEQWTVVDVREPYEYRSGVIAHARMIPMSQLSERMDELASQRPLAIVCAHGNRSREVASFLAEHGYRAHNVEGGMERWHAGGHPTVRP